MCSFQANYNGRAKATIISHNKKVIIVIFNQEISFKDKLISNQEPEILIFHVGSVCFKNRGSESGEGKPIR